MGCWGMGITQSDEFCEVYDRFLEEYDQGKSVAEIAEAILSEYLSEFDKNDGVLHDVYFAIAKAEWMCTEQSKKTLDKVQHIIDNDLNIAFYRELGATKSDLQLRYKNLQKFWETLQIPRKSPRKRNIPKNEQLSSLPKGTVFWYRVKSDIYGAIVLDVIKNNYLIALSDKLSTEPKNPESILNSSVFSLSWFMLLLPQKRMHVVGNVEITDNYNGHAGLYVNETINLSYCENCGLDQDWRHEIQRYPIPDKQIKNIMSADNVPSSFIHEDILNNNTERLQKINRIKADI